MRPKHFWIALLLAIGCAASSGHAAVELSSLSNPTLQTLIGMGSTPVQVGPFQLSDFGFIDDSTGVARTSAEIQVQAFTANGYGLQFVANWFAADGTMVDDVISYDIEAPPSTHGIGQISLLSNGTAPAPATGTFTTTTLLASLAGGGTAAPVLSTYNDGVTIPIDTTSPDVNYVLQSLPPQEQLHIIDTLFAISTPADSTSTAGVATASVLQNAFFPAQIPEPNQPGWIFLPMALVFCSSSRRWRRSARLAR